MRRRIFTIIFLSLLIRPLISFSEEDLDSLRDPFTPQLPLPPVEKIEKPAVQNPPQPESPPKQEAIIPQPSLQRQAVKEEPLKPPVVKISGVIWNSARPQAIINDQIVKVGDYIEEWTIEKIDKDGIEISARGSKILIPTDFGLGGSSPKAAVDSSKRSSRGKI